MSSFSGENVDESSSSPADSDAYKNWLVKHPSALTDFERIMTSARGKQVVVFLDYDGTLTPIVNDPSAALMTDEMRAVVREVASRFPTGIISGRARKKVRNFVKLDELYYAGSHGMDIKGPPVQGNEEVKVAHKAAKESRPALEKIIDRLTDETSDIVGCSVEDNKYCVSVHYRNVLENNHPAVEMKVRSVVDEYPGFVLKDGNMVWEVRPDIPFHKGSAVKFLLNALGYERDGTYPNVFPIFIGDDTTDEDAFQETGIGCPILVSTKPKDTLAVFSLTDPFQVLEFLSHASRWRP